MAVGFAGGIFVYPCILLADIVAMEQVDPAGREVVASGGLEIAVGPCAAPIPLFAPAPDGDSLTLEPARPPASW